MQETLKKTKAYHAFSYFLWKETNHKFLKVAAAEILFSGAYGIGTTCFDDILCGNWKDITFHFVRKVAGFFETSVWKNSVFYVLSPQ